MAIGGSTVIAPDGGRHYRASLCYTLAPIPEMEKFDGGSVPLVLILATIHSSVPITFYFCMMMTTTMTSTDETTTMTKD